MLPLGCRRTQFEKDHCLGLNTSFLAGLNAPEGENFQILIVLYKNAKIKPNGSRFVGSMKEM